MHRPGVLGIDKRTPFNIILYSEESLQNNVILPSKLLRYLCPIPDVCKLATTNVIPTAIPSLNKGNK